MTEEQKTKRAALIQSADVNKTVAEMTLERYAKAEDKNGLKRAHLGIAGFHAEQAIEKLLRAELIKATGREYPSRTFPIRILAEDLAEKHVPVVEWIYDRADEITSWATCYEEGKRSEADVVSVEFALTIYDEQKSLFLLPDNVEGMEAKE